MCNELKKFMRKFTVITKDGIKWLRPINPHPEKLSTHGTPEAFYYNPEWQEFEKNNFDAPYLGDRSEGTVLSEERVTLIYQMGFDSGAWTEVTYDEYIDKGERFPVRIAYTDTESHDRHISDGYPGIDYQPLFNHMSKVHGLTLTAGEMDEIIGLSTYILAKK